MPEINLTAGTLPPPACFASEQDRLDAYAAAMIAQFSTSPEWSAGTVSPALLDLYWLRLDSGSNPVEVLKYNATAPAGWSRLTTQFTYGVGGGVANAYTVTLSPPSPGVNQAYRTGAVYAFIATAANTGASTLSVDGLTTKAIVKFGLTALAANDIVANQMCVVVYDGTRFHLLNPGFSVSATNFVPGIDRQFLRTGPGPVTQWESGYITPAAGYLTIPTNVGGIATFNHNLGVLPIFWDIGIICTNASGDPATGYAQNDYIPLSNVAFPTNFGIQFTTFANSTVIGVVRGSYSFPAYVFSKTSPYLAQPLTENNWRVMARAIR